MLNTPEPLSDSQENVPESSFEPKSRFNIRLMWRMNYLSILIFIGAIIYYVFTRLR